MKNKIIIALVILAIVFIVGCEKGFDKCDLNKDGKVDAFEKERCEQQQIEKPPQPQGKCGDDICDEFEKANPNLCPQDCETQPDETTPDYGDNTLEYEDSPFGIHDPEVLHSDSIEDVTETGAKWVRYAGRNGIVWDLVEPKKNEFSWNYQDILYLETYNNGIKMFVSTIAANKAYGTEEGRLPTDGEAYKEFLRRTVERYDGDGVDDAPGSPVVDVWQIENEPDLFWKDNPGDYAKLLKESYEVIKKANPSAKVAIAGVGTPYDFYEENVFPRGNKFYISVLKELNSIKDNQNDKYFDIFDFHWYPFSGEYNLFKEPIPNPFNEPISNQTIEISFIKYLNLIEQMLNGYNYANTPIFITETAQYTGVPKPPGWINYEMISHSEKDQANFLFKLYVFSIAHDVKKIFWVTLTEWHNFANDPDGVFDHVGLINNPLNKEHKSHKKLAYYTYKLMAEKLEGSDWDNIKTIQESDNVYAYKFTNKETNKPVWVVWWDYFDDTGTSKTINLDFGDVDSVVVTEAVPNADSGADLDADDYPDFFDTETKTVSNRKVSLTLGESPVFVEGK